MGNVESHGWDRVLYGEEQGRLSRKHTSRSLRVTSRRSRRPRHSSSGKVVDHRSSEASTRSSSTPSIPQSLADQGLEPFDQAATLADFPGPAWADHVPESFHHHPADPAAGSAAGCVLREEQDVTYLERVSDGPREGSNFKKKRSKSADMWREDSLEFSLSDLSQEHLTSTEEMVHATDNGSSPQGLSPLGFGDRSNSLDELYDRRSPSGRSSHNGLARYCRGVHEDEEEEDDDEALMAPSEDDRAAFGGFTLPCRRSHCLSEGLPGQQERLQGWRVQMTQDVSAGDRGVRGGAMSTSSRRHKTMSASFSTCSMAGGGGVYENFRRELGMVENPKWAEPVVASGEPRCGALSLALMPDVALDAGQGIVRKAGALAIKNFLVHKKNKKVELATRRKWKRYWVCLKGCTLFFYETDSRSGVDHNSDPKRAVWAEGSIVQAVPEHPKKDFVFCLSNSHGDAFLFQTSSQTELENWITAVHSACAAALARQHRRDDTVRLLRAEARRLEQRIDMDEKMKKMGEMQLATVANGKKRKTILEQIFLWEQNLEQFHVDLFRFRCYMASLQGGELPNPKGLLAIASRPTKLTMGRLGVFSVSTFHALVAARTESRPGQCIQGASSKRRSRFSSLWGLDTTTKKKLKGRPSISQVFSDGEELANQRPGGPFEDPAKECVKETEESVKRVPKHNTGSDVWLPDYLTPSWASLPNDQPVLAVVRPGESTLAALETICKAHRLDPGQHYLRLKFMIGDRVQFYAPDPEEDMGDLLYSEIEIRPRITKLVQFDRSESCTVSYGFSISAVEEDGAQRLYVTCVAAGGLAFAKGLNGGDLVLRLNGTDSSALSCSDLAAAFSRTSLSLAVSGLPAVERSQLCLTPLRHSDRLQELHTDIFSQSQEEILDDGNALGLESTGDSVDGDCEIFSDTEGSGQVRIGKS